MSQPWTKQNKKRSRRPVKNPKRKTPITWRKDLPQYRVAWENTVSGHDGATPWVGSKKMCMARMTKDNERFAGRIVCVVEEKDPETGQIARLA